jgi:hypothetical protein
MALFGSIDPAMARIYTRAAEAKRLAAQAVAMLAENESETSIPARGDDVRDGEQKSK